jgi:hypothetical protein
MILVVEGMFFSHVKLGVGELWGGGGIPQISNHLKQSLVPESTSWALLLTELSSGMNPLFKSTLPSVEGKVPLDTMPSRCTRNFLPVLLHVYVCEGHLFTRHKVLAKDLNEVSKA